MGFLIMTRDHAGVPGTRLGNVLFNMHLLNAPEAVRSYACRGIKLCGFLVGGGELQGAVTVQASPTCS